MVRFNEVSFIVGVIVIESCTLFFKFGKFEFLFSDAQIEPGLADTDLFLLGHLCEEFLIHIGRDRRYLGCD